MVEVNRFHELPIQIEAMATINPSWYKQEQGEIEGVYYLKLALSYQHIQCIGDERTWNKRHVSDFCAF